MTHWQTYLAGLAMATALSFIAAPSDPAPIERPSVSSRQPKQPIRENVANMEADHPALVSYRMAITAMKKRPAEDPLSWTFQANMHGTVKQNESWDWCMHKNWWFLPWHRGYVYYFERIIRKMSDDDGFRLPYWAWEKEGENVLPAPFREPMYVGQANPLYEASRNEHANKGKPLTPENSVGTFSTDWEIALNAPAFTLSNAELSFGGVRTDKAAPPKRPMPSHFFGVMENYAHNKIHDAVGGIMDDTKTAAGDPIFWLHHANVDRLWNRWLEIQSHHLPDPDKDKDWYDQTFPFYDENGMKVVVSVKDILDIAKKESRYDDDRIAVVGAPPGNKGPAMKPNLVALGQAKPGQALGTTPFTKELTLDANAKPNLKAALATPATDAAAPAVLLRIEDIKPQKQPGLIYEVFLLKKGETPSKKSYVGPITFFGHLPGDGHEDARFTQGFDVTKIVRTLQSANKGNLPDFEVSIVPHSTAGLSDAALAKQKISIPISNITLKLVTMEQQ